MTKEHIGFIGVGLMGHGMAKNILAKGYPLKIVAHRNREPIDDLVAKGASEASSLSEVGKACDIIHICAPGSPQIEAIVNELIPHLSPKTIIIDCSTAEPSSTQMLSERLSAMDCAMVDAPLGGTPVQAESGELAAMVGAEKAVFERVLPIIQTWAKSIVHIGPPGAGHKMKLLNNFLSLGYGALYAEALALSQKVGITTQEFDSVIRGSRMDCGFYQTFMGYAVEGNRDAHKFTLTNALKDMTYLEGMANSARVSNPIGNAIKNSYSLAYSDDGDGPEDYVPHLVDYVAKRNAVKK